MNIRELVKLSIMWLSSIIYRNHKSKIIFYHDVYCTTNYKALDADVKMGTPLELFKKHIEVIRSEGYKIVSRISNNYGEVAIMFDDGFRGIWECRDYFFEQCIQPTIFLPVEYIGRKDDGILTIDEILELQSHGFNFECHGWSHGELTQFNDGELKRELWDSKQKLQTLLNKKITGLCMPVGVFSTHLLNEIRKYDYTNVYSCIPGNFDYHPHKILTTRNLCQFASPTEVKLMLRGGNEMLRKRYERIHYKN